jgi:hypothetical protein
LNLFNTFLTKILKYLNYFNLNTLIIVILKKRNSPPVTEANNNVIIYTVSESNIQNVTDKLTVIILTVLTCNKLHDT